MILKEFTAFNYKSCRHTHISLQSTRPSLFIGENDCGKTSSLNSIRFLLVQGSRINLPNDKTGKNDLSHTSLTNQEINDLLNSNNLPRLFYGDHSEDPHVVFIGKFEIENFEINGYEISPQLKWAIESSEFDTNEKKYLIKARVFDSTDGESSVYYLHHHPVNNEISSIYSSTQAQINSAMKQHNPGNHNLRNDNDEGRYSNYEKIRSILQTTDCELKFVKLNDDSKQKKWKSDLSVFPEHAYLSWNESLEGITKAASALLDSSIEHEVSRAQQFSRSLSNRAQKKSILNCQRLEFIMKFLVSNQSMQT
ncbi:AAA family ATPase [Endozoicomonas sp.]|uniref:AAA family ATPase n=1 Tax=Endozoicomonas sp. TaxID=1892382 RepID=UPI002884B6C3|nr:AAA family ATPase [Endozoicomonas sp.]